jgi:hypothetical protein
MGDGKKKMKEGNVQPVLEGHALASAADEKNILVFSINY